MISAICAWWYAIQGQFFVYQNLYPVDSDTDSN